MKRLFSIAVVIAVIATMVSCGPDKKESPIAEEFDMNSIPCGTLMESSLSGMVILTDDGRMIRVEVPNWVYEVYSYKEGVRIGNCSQNSEYPDE